MLIEQLQYNLLLRWFVGMEMDEGVWNHAGYSKNRERLLNGEIAESFFRRVLERAKPYVSDKHFTVGGTLIDAWASQKSFRRKDGHGNHLGVAGDVDFHGERRLTDARGRTERDAALLLAEAVPGGKRVTLGGDKNYDSRELVGALRGMNITPHVAQNDRNRRSAVDGRTTRHAGYEASQRKRKRVEQSFG